MYKRGLLFVISGQIDPSYRFANGQGRIPDTLSNGRIRLEYQKVTEGFNEAGGLWAYERLLTLL